MPSNDEVIRCRYHYDPLDRLVSISSLTDADSQQFYCKSWLATKIQGQLTRSIFQHDDQLLAQQLSSEVMGDTTLLATDRQRSVLRTVNSINTRLITYSPYGHRPAESGLLSLLGFNGEPQDPVTGHYLLGNGHRAFNPILMRFNSPDIMSPFEKGGLNPYTYCLGDPINYKDPTGNIPLLLAAKYNLTWKFFKKGIISKHTKNIVGDATYSRERFINRLEWADLSKRIQKFNNKKAKQKFLFDYEKTMHKSDITNEPIQLRKLDPSDPADIQEKNLFNYIATKDSSGKVNGYSHDKLEYAARYKNNDDQVYLPAATSYFEKLNKIRGKKITKHHRRYIDLSQREFAGSRDR